MSQLIVDKYKQDMTSSVLSLTDHQRWSGFCSPIKKQASLAHSRWHTGYGSTMMIVQKSVGNLSDVKKTAQFHDFLFCSASGMNLSTSITLTSIAYYVSYSKPLEVHVNCNVRKKLQCYD